MQIILAVLGLFCLLGFILIILLGGEKREPHKSKNVC